MIFRKPDYSETSEAPEVVAILQAAKEFAQKISPDGWKEKVDEIYRELTVVLCDNSRTCKRMADGMLSDIRVPSGTAAYKFFASSDSRTYKTTQGIAIRPQASAHVITHEVLHAFSSDSGITEDSGGYVKTGARYAEFDKDGNVIAETNNSLNEAITDALASRAYGRLGPGTGSSYASQVIMADLLMGENIENNAFIQDVYFGKSQKFAEDFAKTLKTSKVKFADYLQGFNVIGSEEDTQKSDELLKGAVEYNLRKAQTPEEIDKVYAFQQKVINIYKDGGLETNFMDDEDIARMESLLQFADKIQKQCKSNLTAQKLITRPNTHES